MTATTLTLTEFLLARIAEDEREAQVMMRQYEAGGDVSSRRWRRVLAECEAQRRIVEACIQAEGDRLGDERNAYGYYLGLLEACHLLALPYVDHPDYREEWRV